VDKLSACFVMKVRNSLILVKDKIFLLRNVSSDQFI